MKLKHKLIKNLPLSKIEKVAAARGFKDTSNYIRSLIWQDIDNYGLMVAIRGKGNKKSNLKYVTPNKK